MKLVVSVTTRCVTCSMISSRLLKGDFQKPHSFCCIASLHLFPEQKENKVYDIPQMDNIQFSSAFSPLFYAAKIGQTCAHTTSENRMRAKASLIRIILSSCRGVAVITCNEYTILIRIQSSRWSTLRLAGIKFHLKTERNPSMSRHTSLLLVMKTEGNPRICTSESWQNSRVDKQSHKIQQVNLEADLFE